jgi:hypothetical protein
MNANVIYFLLTNLEAELDKVDTTNRSATFKIKHNTLLACVKEFKRFF